MQSATFYHFFDLADPMAFREWAFAEAEKHALRGILLVAEQGVNATVAGERDKVDLFLAALEDKANIKLGNVKYSPVDAYPFRAMRIRVVKELIKFLREGADPRVAVGQYVKPKQWNELIEQEDVLLIDTRNGYELQAGTFDGAVDPKIDSFTEFAHYVDEKLDPETHPKVAMFCTGGIRCEVATSYLLQKGFKDVFHLEGGILKYFEEVPKEESKWKGECFVFDHRVTVDHSLNPGNFLLCYSCGWPMDKEDVKDPKNEGCVRCSHCRDDQSEADYLSACERKKQNELAIERGQNNPRRISLE